MKIKDIITIGLLLIIIVLLLKYCNGGRTVEVVKEVHDTAWVPQKKDTAYIPQPYAVYLKGKPIPVYKWDTLYLPEVIEDSSCIAYYNQLKDYFTRMYLYSDTVRNKYGYVAINDTITQNKIAGRGTSMNFLIPEVTHTITLTQPPRNQVYIGAGLLGNEKEFVKGYEFNLSLKTKRDHIIGLGYEQIFGIDHFYKLEYRRKISLKR